ASFGETTWIGSNPFTSPARRTGSPSVSNVEIQPTPLSPASAARQVDGASSPRGVTAPIPVTATRFTRPTVPRVLARVPLGITWTAQAEVGRGDDVEQAGSRLFPLEPVGQV